MQSDSSSEGVPTASWEADDLAPRDAAWRGGSRAAIVRSTLDAAPSDPEFLDWIATGDQARNDARWGDAEYAYWRALRLHPFHPGYRVQYAHMLKEQGKLLDAEIHYRSAAALGTPDADVRKHLDFVCARQGVPIPETLAGPMEGASPLADPPTEGDVRCLAALLWVGPPVANEEIAKFLRGFESTEEVALALLVDARFVRGNLCFLQLLREQGGLAA